MAETYLSDDHLAARFGVHRMTPWRWVRSDPHLPKPIVWTLFRRRWRKRRSRAGKWRKPNPTPHSETATRLGRRRCSFRQSCNDPNIAQTALSINERLSQCLMPIL